MTRVRYYTLGQEFWEKLPPAEWSLASTEHLAKHVSFGAIVAACERASDLVVLRYYDVTLVGIKGPNLQMPSVKEASIEEFVKANSHHWALIPEEGCSVVYADDEQSEEAIVKLPRLKELEQGREADPAGLLFGIVSAIGLGRVAQNASAEYVTLY